MMMKIALAGVLCAVLLVASCIFQNNPLEPNQPPSIQSYAPRTTYFTLISPDSCVFCMKAVDPDGDNIRYSFKVGDISVSAQDSFVFHASVPGEYEIRGEAWDAAVRAFHDWHVTVIKKDNVPPFIRWFQPDQTDVACAVGDTLEFNFQVEDDNPEALRFSYLLDGALLRSGSPALIYRFMERGDFLLEGIAWDGQYGDTVSWRVGVIGDPDTTKPAPIVDLTGGPGESDGMLSLEWTAPGDDGNVGKAASYIVRTSTYPIQTEKDWEQSEGKIGEPVPSPAGSRERMTIRNLGSASYVYVTMRAVDDFFNISPLGNSAKLLVRGVDVGGRVINAATNESIEGCTVTTSIRTDSSAADGSYFLGNVPSYTTSVVARDENIQGQMGDYFDCILPIAKIAQFIDMDFLMIPAFDLVNTVEPDVYQGRFYAFFKDITGTNEEMQRPSLFKGWNHWPLRVYNPPQAHQGVDLQAEASSALADWESSTGLDLFIEVAQPDNADVIIVYDSTLSDRHHVKTPAFNGDGTPARREIWIYLLGTEVPIAMYPHLVFAHELGHVFGLYHSRNIGHLLVGLTFPQTEHPTLDEIRVVQIIYHMPYIYEYKTIVED